MLHKRSVHSGAKKTLKFFWCSFSNIFSIQCYGCLWNFKQLPANNAAFHGTCTCLWKEKLFAFSLMTLLTWEDNQSTIPDKNVETKCNFCNFLLYLVLVNSNPPFPQINVGFVVLSFLLQNPAFNIELGEGEKLFFKRKRKYQLSLNALNYFCPGL